MVTEAGKGGGMRKTWIAAVLVSAVAAPGAGAEDGAVSLRGQPCDLRVEGEGGTLAVRHDRECADLPGALAILAAGEPAFADALREAEWLWFGRVALLESGMFAPCPAMAVLAASEVWRTGAMTAEGAATARRALGPSDAFRDLLARHGRQVRSVSMEKVLVGPAETEATGLDCAAMPGRVPFDAMTGFHLEAR